MHIKKHALVRLQEDAAFYGTPKTKRRWEFSVATSRKEIARGIRHMRRADDRRALVTGLLIFVAATGEVPSKADIKNCLTPGTTQARPSIPRSSIQDLL